MRRGVKMMTGEMVIEELDSGAFKLGESIVRFLVLQVRNQKSWMK